MFTDLSFDAGKHGQHPTHSQWGYCLGQTEPPWGVVGNVQDSLWWLAVESRVQNPGESASGGSFRRSLEEEANESIVVDLDGEEQWCLALVHLLELLGSVQVTRRQRREVVAELEQQLQTVLGLQGVEVLGQLSHRGGQVTFHCVPLSMGTRTELPHSVQEPS